jgi:UDP-N-acetylmuramoyl-L-alanyl-D-glutamate--2,6-diaminopimelate ligase
MLLAELISGLEVQALGGDAGAVRICDLTDDSRTVVPNSLFIARSGSRSDGHKYIPEAIRAGAVAVLTDRNDPAMARALEVPVIVARDLPRTMARMAERFYGEPTGRLKLIGITGTNGKTTTAHLVHQIFNGVGTRCGLIGTVMVDDGTCIAPATLTTPPSTELSRTLATMAEAGCRAAVMEVSSHALHQGRASALRFDVGVFTNLTGDHLDYHGTMEAYAEAKAMLFAMLPAEGWAIVNAEDEWSERVVRDCRARVIRCRVENGTSRFHPPGTGGAPLGEAVAAIRGMNMTGARVHFAGPWGAFETGVRLLGRHNVMNALQAVCASWAAGVPGEALERQIRGAKPPPGRLEPVTAQGDSLGVLVDYAHTDDALRKVLTGLRPLVKQGPDAGRLIVIFGCGGDRDKTKRPRMGAAAAELADQVIVTSDNPRTERPSDIINQILSGIPGDSRERVMVEVDRRRAIHRGVLMARPGDLVLIAGKGHETEQILPDGAGGTIKHHFDDREVARAALAERRQAALRIAP